MFYPRIKYQFVNNTTGITYDLKEDPLGWETSERNIKRSTKNFSLYREYSKNLEFIGDSSRKLETYFNAYDIEADISLLELRLVPDSTVEEYYTHTEGELDFLEYFKKDRTVKIPFKSGGLEKKINAQIKEKFNIERLQSITGQSIGNLQLDDTLLTGREISLVSELSCKNETVLINSSRKENDENKKHREPVPLKITSNSDKENITQPIYTRPSGVDNGAYGSESFTNGYSVRECFFLKSDVNKIDFNVDYNISFKIGENSDFVGDVDDKNFKLKLVKLSNGDSFNNSETLLELISIQDNVLTKKGQRFNARGGISIDEILIDQSLALVFEMEGDYSHETFPQDPFGWMFIELEDIDATLKISEPSQTPETTTKSIFYHNLIKRLCQIITGKNDVFYSGLFGQKEMGYDEDGEFSFNAVTSGFWIRQFFDKNLETSISDILKSIYPMHMASYSFYKIDGVEKMVVESLKFFFQEDFVIDLGDVDDLEEEVAKEFYYRGTSFGYKEPKEGILYEEAMGLDEHNVLTNWTLPITRSEETYEKISEIRNDGYGKAFASRKPKLNFPEEDTRYDQDLFHLDLKESLGLAYVEKTWQDYYSERPSGIFSPDTATGLNFTPFRMSERHEWFYCCGLKKDVFNDNYIRFASSIGNATLVTKKTGEDPRPENGDKIISETDLTSIRPMWYKLTKKIDYKLSQQLDGFTNIGGREIPNVFFKVRFRHNNKVKYGYVFEVKPNGNGEWKLLKAL